MLSLYSSDMKYAFVTKKKRRRRSELLGHSRSWRDFFAETEWGLFAAYLTGLILILLVVEFGFIPWFFWQFQSFCRIKWTFENKNCFEVQETIVRQIETWGFDSQCWGYNVEGCKYQLLYTSKEMLHAQHTINYTTGIDVQDLVLRFSQIGKVCKVQASAISLPNLGTLFMDTGGNYCTLRNLPRAAGLVFSESAEPNGCRWRKWAECLFETGKLRYKKPPHVQSIYERGTLISSMVVEEELAINIIEPESDNKKEADKH